MFFTEISCHVLPSYPAPPTTHQSVSEREVHCSHLREWHRRIQNISTRYFHLRVTNRQLWILLQRSAWFHFAYINNHGALQFEPDRAQIRARNTSKPWFPALSFGNWPLLMRGVRCGHRSSNIIAGRCIVCTFCSVERYNLPSHIFPFAWNATHITVITVGKSSNLPLSNYALPVFNAFSCRPFVSTVRFIFWIEAYLWTDNPWSGFLSGNLLSWMSRDLNMTNEGIQPKN
jgi:hypothetical protein